MVIIIFGAQSEMEGGGFRPESCFLVPGDPTASAHVFGLEYSVVSIMVRLCGGWIDRTSHNLFDVAHAALLCTGEVMLARNLSVGHV